MKNDSVFTQTFNLFKVNLKKDWKSLLLWWAIICSLVVVVAYKFVDIYGTKKELTAILPTLKSQSMIALFGKFKLSSTPTTAQVFANEMVIFTVLLFIIMNIWLAVKNTRTEEDRGTLEEIQALAVGKLSSLTSTVLELVLINVVIGATVSFGLIFSNLRGSTLNGDLLLGISLASCGLFFGVVALLCSELANNSSQATSLSYLVFAVCYFGRMITDIKDSSLTWFNPIGWVEKVQPYSLNDWLPIWLYFGFGILLLVVIFAFDLTRDTGAGLLPSHQGKSHASPLLNSIFSLEVRLNIRTFIFWLIGLFALGYSYGSILNTIGDILKTNPTMKQVFGQAAINSANHTLILNYVSLLNVVFMAVSAIFPIQLIMKLYKDETKGYLEAIYATPTSRLKVYASTLLISMISACLTLITTIYGMYVANINVLGKHALYWSTFMKGFLGYLPVILIFIGLAALFLGWFPKANLLIWLYLGYGFISIYLGGLLNFPKWATKLTPLGWIKKIPIHAVNYEQVWIFVVTACILMILGYIGYQNRDLHSDN